MSDAPIELQRRVMLRAISGQLEDGEVETVLKDLSFIQAVEAIEADKDLEEFRVVVASEFSTETVLDRQAFDLAQLLSVLYSDYDSVGAAPEAYVPLRLVLDGRAYLSDGPLVFRLAEREVGEDTWLAQVQRV